MIFRSSMGKYLYMSVVIRICSFFRDDLLSSPRSLVSSKTLLLPFEHLKLRRLVCRLFTLRVLAKDVLSPCHIINNDSKNQKDVLAPPSTALGDPRPREQQLPTPCPQRATAPSRRRLLHPRNVRHRVRLPRCRPLQRRERLPRSSTWGCLLC